MMFISLHGAEKRGKEQNIQQFCQLQDGSLMLVSCVSTDGTTLQANCTGSAMIPKSRVMAC
jgi:hypothetical protein